MLGIAEVDVGDDVDNTPVCLFRQTFVFAAVSGFHMEDRNVQPFRRNGRQTRVGITENEQCVGLDVDHELVGAVDDIANCSAEIIADGIHIYFGIGQFKIFEEYAVEIVVVVLSGVGEDYVEVLTAFVDGRGEPDYFGTCADNNQKLEFAVFGELYIGVVEFHWSVVLNKRSDILFVSIPGRNMYPDDWDRKFHCSTSPSRDLRSRKDS